MESILQYPPGDSRMIDKIVHQLKSQGIFDQFRKECLADVDTKPAYQNLHQRVEGSVTGFLASQEWRPDLNKNQLRDSLRKHIHESGFLDIGVERIVDQVVNPKIMTVFMPQVEDVVYNVLGLEKPKKGKENQNVYVAPLTIENLTKKEERKLPTLTDLLPKELEPISPESDTLKCKEDNSMEDGEVGFADEKEEEESSPPFELIEEINSHAEESSMDSHLSGISELTSHDSQHSHTLFTMSGNANRSTPKQTFDLSNNDSQLSKVSSSSRLSIVSLGEQDYKASHDTQTNDDSQQSKFSLHVLCQETQTSASVEIIKKEQETLKADDYHIPDGLFFEDSDSSFKQLHIVTHDNSEADSMDESKESEIKTEDQDKKLEESVEKKFYNEPEDDSDRNEEKYNQFDLTVTSEASAKFENRIDSVDADKVDIEAEEGELYSDLLSREKADESLERKSEDIVDGSKLDVAFENNYTERTEKKMDEKPIIKVEELLEKKMEDTVERLDNKSERKAIEGKPEEKFEGKIAEKCEKKADEKLERKVNEKTERKVDEKLEKKTEKKYEKQLEEKVERKGNDKSEKKQDDRLTKKSDDRSGRKTEDKLEKRYSEKKSDEKIDKKVDERSERKSLEKPEKKFDEKADRKLEEKYDKKYESKPEKKFDEKADRKLEEKSDKKHESKSEKKDDKHEKKHDRHREDRDKSKDKKKVSNESRDQKKGENSSHSSENDRRKSDKDKHQKERGDSRGRNEKTNKYDSKDPKNKIKYEEKLEKDSSKEKSKSDIKDDRKTEEKDKKTDKDSIKERSKKEAEENYKHDKDTKKSKSDDKKEKDMRDKQKLDDKGRSKHEDKHRDKTKSEGKDKSDKEKSSRYDEKTKDGSRSNSKDNKDRSKQDVREKVKETLSKSDEKKSKDKLKHDERFAKLPEKGNVKKSESKSSRSTDHKSKDSSKKSKDSKGKSVADDHRIHRDKHSEDRRSADRDSNGTPQDRSLGGTTSRTNGNESRPSQSRHEKGGTTSTSSKSDSGGNSDSSCTHNQSAESSMNVKEPPLSPSKSASPPSSLPFKKRPLSHHSEDEHSDGEDNDVEHAVQLHNSIKKPKIAANIFEVKKIMMLRKTLAKKERKLQKDQQVVRERAKDIRSGKNLPKPILARRKKLGDVEKSLRKEVHVSLSQKEAPKVDVDKEDLPELKYFESELIPSALSQADTKFLAYVKRLIESDTLSEVSDSGSDVSESEDVISLTDINFDEIVAKELGATLIETDKGFEVLFQESPERSRSTSVASESGTAIDYNIIGDTVVRLDVDSRPGSGMSNWSDKSDLSWGGSKRRRQRSSSTNSNKSNSDKLQQSSAAPNEEKHLDSNKKSRKRVFSRKKPKKDIEPNPVINPKPPIEKRELRRARKPNTRYSSKEFASLTDEENSYDRFPSEEKMDSVQEQLLESKSDPVVVLQDVSKSNVVENNPPVSISANKIKSSRTKIPATVTHDDEDSSDHEHVSESVGDGYDIIRENNNVDKGSSEDERGCGDGSMLNQDLILPTLRDLMVESGFRRQDDKSDFLPSLVGVVNCVSKDGDEENSEKQVVRDYYVSSERTDGKKMKLGRSRRVGLSRPLPKSVSEQANNEVGVKRTATPPDFVMPLSPESDVSASSGEARKALLDKVGDNNANASASNSDDKTAHVSNSRFGDQEVRRSLRSGGHGILGARGQRYNSDDLYKPRPLFSQGSRRVRGRVSPTINEGLAYRRTKLTRLYTKIM